MKTFLAILLTILGTIFFITILSFEIMRVKRKNSEIHKSRKEEEKARKTILSDEKKIQRISKIGKLGKTLKSINDETFFLNVEYKDSIICKSFEEYDNYNCKAYIYEKGFDLLKVIYNLLNNEKKNTEIFKHYKKQFFSCCEFTSADEIKKIHKRGMSVKEFQRIEQKYGQERVRDIKYPKEPSITIIARYGRNESTIPVNLMFAKDLLERNFLQENSQLLKKCQELNEKYKDKLYKKEEYSVICQTYNEYVKFNKFDAICKIGCDPQELYEKAESLERTYEEYREQYLLLSNCYLQKNPNEPSYDVEIMGVEKFQEIEREIFKKLEYSQNLFVLNIIFTVEYTSPAKRNYYKKEEIVTKTDLEEIIKQIQIDLEEKRQKEEIKKEKKLQKREERLLEKEAAFGRIETREKIIAKKEKDLFQREKEFFIATHGQIYAPSAEPLLMERNNAAEEETGKELSTWGKLKKLQKEFENGEISYQEYDERRKSLL